MRKYLKFKGNMFDKIFVIVGVFLTISLGFIFYIQGLNKDEIERVIICEDLNAVENKNYETHKKMNIKNIQLLETSDSMENTLKQYMGWGKGNDLIAFEYVLSDFKKENNLIKVNLSNKEKKIIQNIKSSNSISCSSIFGNKEKIIINYDNNDYSNHICTNIIYDLGTGNKKTIKSFYSFRNFSENSRYLFGRDYRNKYTDKIGIYDLKKGQEKTIYLYGNEKNINKVDILKPLVVTDEGKYLIFYTENYVSQKSEIYIKEINSQDKAKLVLKDFRVNYVKELGEAKLLLSGVCNGKNGLYIYNINNKSMKNLLQGEVREFSLSNDNKKLAYKIADSDGTWNLCVGKFSEEGIQGSQSIFKISDLRERVMMWNEDNNILFVKTFSTSIDMQQCYIVYFMP